MTTAIPGVYGRDPDLPNIRQVLDRDTTQPTAENLTPTVNLLKKRTEALSRVVAELDAYRRIVSDIDNGRTLAEADLIELDTLARGQVERIAADVRKLSHWDFDTKTTPVQIPSK